MEIIEKSLKDVQKDPEYLKTGFHLTCAINTMAEKNNALGILFHQPYFDTGTMKGYHNALKWVLNMESHPIHHKPILPVNLF
jgi:UTP-glucose-1-phosphate uridylyltransferase